jgi:hypothetical protein
MVFSRINDYSCELSDSIMTYSRFEKANTLWNYGHIVKSMKNVE